MEAEKLLRALESLSTWTLPSASGSDAGSVANSVESGLSQSLSGHVPVKKTSFIKRRSASKVLGFGGGGPAESKARLVMEVAEALTSGTAPEKGKDFAGVLAQAIEHLVNCCDDQDASVRLAAEEALNIVLKEHILAQQVTILIELFKQVKKNDKPRCVKAAWSRLAFFANYAKPQRFRNRAFAVNMLPCIIQLARRDEDSIQETLAEGLPAVLKVLGLYLTETEIKSLTRTFLPSLSAESGLRRRTAAANLVTVARYSKKPELAFLWLLRGLLGLARSTADNAPSAVYAGVLLTVKNILHFLSSADGAALAPLDVSILIQVLRLILDCCAQSDHNVQGFALDALHALLTYPSPALHAVLSSPGPPSLQISPSDSTTSSDFSLDFGADDPADNVEELAEISVEALTSPAPLIGRPVDSVSEVSDAASIMSSVEDAFTAADDNDYVLEDESPMTEGPDFGEELEVDSEERSGEAGIEETGESEGMEIGHLFGDTAALVYIARYLSVRFLIKLDGSFKSGVRVSVQSSALVCLADVITKLPTVLSQPLLPLGDDCPMISANLTYLCHPDPLLQAQSAILTAVCIAQNIPCPATSSGLIPTVDTILRLVQSESASAGKLAVEALSICTLPMLYTSLHAPTALSIVRRVLDILHQRPDLYWLLKVELLQFFRTVPLNWVVYTESMVGRENHRKLDVFEAVVGVLMKCLNDSDPRVSRTAVDSLCWLPYSFAFPKLASPQTYKVISRAYEEGGKGAWEGLWYSMSTGLTFPYNVHDLARTTASVEDAVSVGVGMVLDVLIAGPKKEDLHGPIAALTRLSMLYPPTVYASCWFGPLDENDLGAGKISSSATGILRRLLELAMHNGIASDLTVHADLLRLMGTFLAGLAFIVHGKAKSPTAEESPWIFSADAALRMVIENLLRHLARMLGLMKAVIDGQKLTDVFPSLKSNLLLPTPQALASTLRRRHGTDTLRKTDRKSRNLFDIKGKSGLGALGSADVYGGVLDALKKAWQKQRTVLSADIRNDKFRCIMSSVLISLSQVLEVIPADLVAPHTEELIRYLRITMGMEGAASIYCIEQLLRCLFACNMGQTDNHTLLKDARAHFTPVPGERNFLTAFVENSSKNPGFFPLLYALPVENGTGGVAQEEEWGQRWARSWELRRLEDLEALFKSYSKEKRTAMSDTIRQFEAVVIKALQLYTCTTDIATQSQVLDLLVVLLHLHVNYNVLDGEHIFLKYALKQVELMEVNHINDEEAARLLPYLFRFFIHLSHDKFIFQQRILTHGNVMQLADSLMAGGKGVVGLLNLLFEDAVHRKWVHTVGVEEREAQLEVVLSMLLRCVPQPEAFGLLYKFVMYQLRNSSGIYETKTRDLVEAVFGRLSAVDMTYSTLQDFFRTCAFLDVTRSQNLIESPAFERLFHSLIQSVPRTIGTAAFLAAIIDGFLSNGMVRPLLKLFANINQNHPLESPGDLSHESAGRQFVQTMADLLDNIGHQPSNPLADYVQCSLLKSLTYFAEVVAQGTLKSVLREIDRDKDRFRPMPVVCMVAWMRFRHASTGCDLEPRFWNRTGKFPLEEHLADVMWNFVRSPVEGGHLPFSGADEAFRVLQDYLNDDLSVVEVELLQERFGNNSVSVLDELVKKVVGMETFAVLPLFARPGGLTVQLGLTNMLNSHADSVPVLTGEAKESLIDLWTDEKYNRLKQIIFRLCGLPNDRPEDDVSDDSDPSLWLTGFVRRVALHSRNDHADAIAALMQGLDEETVLTIVTDQGFSPTILRSCFRGKIGTFDTLDTDKFSVLFRAASDVLLEKIAEYAAEDSAGSVNAKNQREWLVLAGALVEFGSRVVQTGGSVPEEAMENVLQFGLYGLKVYAMPGCVYSRLMYRRSLQSVLVCLASSEWSSWIRRNPSSGDRMIESVGHALQKECAFLSGEMPEQANGLIVALVDWFEKCFPLGDQLLSDVIVGLARFPSYIELIRIPPSVHKAGWSASDADTGPIPAEFLHELSVLKEFVGRVGHFGWSSRRSFEEIWMALLSVLSSVPIDEESAADEAQRDGSPVSRIAAGRTALRCITALLLESVLASRPGHPLSRHSEMTRYQSPRRRLDDYYTVISSRHCRIAAEYSWVQQFGRCARRPVYFHLSHFDGLEESSCHWVMKGSPQAAAADGADLPASSNNQIDLKSCLKFVMDLYSHWTSDEKLKRLSPYILDELTKSTVLLSNIFYDEKNFRWMLSLVHQIQRVKNVEDSMLYGHLMDAVGKVASVLDDEKDAVSVVRKSAEGKASQSLVNRVCCARMLLRLLRQQTPGEAQSHKLVQWLLNLSTTIFEAESRARISCGDVMDLLHSVLVVEVDFFVAKPKDTINPYRDMLIQQLHNASNLPFPSLKTLLLVLARHLIDKRPDDGVFREQLIKVALESIFLPPPRSLAVFGFLLCCLEDGKNSSSSRGGHFPLSPDDAMADIHNDPLLIMTMEKLAVIQQRVGRCYAAEEGILGALFTSLLTNKMPLHEAINRVMAEFQSAPPPLLPFTAQLTSMVAGRVKKEGLLAVMEEWIALSLANFAHRQPPGIGAWSLACLFVSASSTHLAALFPYLRARGPLMDRCLREAFLYAGRSFAAQIRVEPVHQLFVAAVQAAAAANRTDDLMASFHQILSARRDVP